MSSNSNTVHPVAISSSSGQPTYPPVAPAQPAYPPVAYPQASYPPTSQNQQQQYQQGMPPPAYSGPASTQQQYQPQQQQQQHQQQHQQQQQQQQYQNQQPNVVVMQPAVVVSTGMPRFTQSPTWLVCPYCHNNVQTSVYHKVGGFTWLVAVVLFFIGCSAGCCLIPFCLNSCKDAEHICPNCRRMVGKYHRL